MLLLEIYGSRRLMAHHKIAVTHKIEFSATGERFKKTSWDLLAWANIQTFALPSHHHDSLRTPFPFFPFFLMKGGEKSENLTHRTSLGSGAHKHFFLLCHDSRCRNLKSFLFWQQQLLCMEGFIWDHWNDLDLKNYNNNLTKYFSRSYTMRTLVWKCHLLKETKNCSNTKQSVSSSEASLGRTYCTSKYCCMATLGKYDSFSK